MAMPRNAPADTAYPYVQQEAQIVLDWPDCSRVATVMPVRRLRGAGEAGVMKRHLPPLLALRAFEAAGRHMSFSKAADELSVTQGAISRQVKLLEDYLGVALFRRLTRQVELTAFGESYLTSATLALDEIERATAASQTEAKTLSISVLPSLGALWLMQRLSNFMRTYPEIRLYISSSLEPANFKRDGLDVALRVGKLPGAIHDPAEPQIDFRMTESWDGLAVIPLWDELITPVVSRRLMERVGPLSSWEDIGNYRLIYNIRRPDCWSCWLKAAGGSIRPHWDRLEVGHSFIAVNAVRDGEGIACVPTIEVDHVEWKDELVKPFDLKIRSAGSYYLIAPKDKAKSREFKLFHKWLSEHHS